MLAGIENKHYEREEVDFTRIIRSVAENFVDFAADKGCDLLINVQEHPCITANESLVEILVSNLLSNAIRHGVENAPISVTLHNRSVVVCNAGNKSLDKDKLFKRFISATPNNPGTGLGLALVKEIGDKYNWRITYAFTEDQHVFSIFF